MVGDESKIIDTSISKVRIVFKFVKPSPSRLVTFRKSVCNIDNKAMIALNVATLHISC